jgi:hypothetical protein
MPVSPEAVRMQALPGWFGCSKDASASHAVLPFTDLLCFEAGLIVTRRMRTSPEMETGRLLRLADLLACSPDGFVMRECCTITLRRRRGVVCDSSMVAWAAWRAMRRARMMRTTGHSSQHIGLQRASMPAHMLAT